MSLELLKVWSNWESRHELAESRRKQWKASIYCTCSHTAMFHSHGLQALMLGIKLGYGGWGLRWVKVEKQGDQVERDVGIKFHLPKKIILWLDPFLSEALRTNKTQRNSTKKKAHLSRYPGESEPNDHIHTTQTLRSVSVRFQENIQEQNEVNLGKSQQR